MTVEKLEFLLPARYLHFQPTNPSFTIGPKDEPDCLKKYAKLLANAVNGSSNNNSVEELVRGIVEGETRVITGTSHLF